MKDFYLPTLDNGGRPNMVRVEEFEDGEMMLSVYTRQSRQQMGKFFNGNPEGKPGDECSAFLARSHSKKEGVFRYMYIGERVFAFDTDDEILEFYAPVGNSAVPYPLAESENNYYLMLENKVLKKSEFTGLQIEDIYQKYYGLRTNPNISKLDFENLTILVERNT